MFPIICKFTQAALQRGLSGFYKPYPAAEGYKKTEKLFCGSPGDEKQRHEPGSQTVDGQTKGQQIFQMSGGFRCQSGMECSHEPGEQQHGHLIDHDNI